jgi:hypothetical protein
MKITKKLLKQIIKEEILKERKLGEGFAFKAEDTPQDETPPLRHSGQKRQQPKPPRFKAEDTPQEPSYKEIPKFPTSLHGKTVDGQLSGNTISFKTNEGNFKLEVTGRGVRGRMGISFTITPELKIKSNDRFINGREIKKILMSK